MLRMDPNNTMRVAMYWMPDRKRKRCRPRETRRRTVEGGFKEMGLTWGRQTSTPKTA